MPSRAYIFALYGSLLFASACAEPDGIDQDGTVFDGISQSAIIKLGGTEPFWSIEITPGADGTYAALFSSPENPDGQSFAVTRFAGNNGLGFSGTLEGKTVQIAVTPGDCNDGMSDRTYPFAVTAAFGDEILLGCAYTSDNGFSGPENP